MIQAAEGRANGHPHRPATRAFGPLPTIRSVLEREERYGALFDACYQPLQAFARRRAAAGDADDLVAEVLTTAWRRLDDIPGDAPLAWLYGVAHRTLANQRRSSDRRRRLVDRITVHQRMAPSPSADPTDVLDALARLREDDRAILRLAAWEELSSAEIAVVLGCTANAAALRLSRARKRLREAMTRTDSSRTHDGRKVTDA